MKFFEAAALGLITIIMARQHAFPAEAAGPHAPANPNSNLPKRSETWVPMRAITRGPRHHWFGYYDKLQFDPSGRFVLGMEVAFEDRSPRPDDAIKVGMIDLQENDRWIELGETRAWNWQQGCMLQWRPGLASQAVWNDREGERFVCRIMDVRTRAVRTIPFPIYTVSPDGRWAMSPDFRRINDMRPGYGYAGIPDPNKAVNAPTNAGIWKVDLETGEARLVITIADMLRITFPGGDISGRKHWFNHLLFSPDGSRFIFLNRWRITEIRNGRPVDSFDTRMLTATPDGADIRVVDDSRFTSHFIWRDSSHILAWTKLSSHGNGFYLFRDDGSREAKVIGTGVMTVNGHCTYLPGGEWILNDTYPDKDRLQHVYLYHIATAKRVPLGSFFMPPNYSSNVEWRVDTHPRFSPDGRFVCIDSAHEDNGRQMYLLDIRKIVSR